MIRRAPKPKGKVDTTWRAELAYAVGLIAADGSLSRNGRHINFTSKDVSLIQTFQRCLGITDIKIGRKSRSKEKIKKYYQTQFGDVLFYSWLIDIGLTPNKSLTLSNLKIPEDYFFDFLRGVWDGDGTIVCTRDPRWKNSYAVSIGFASGSIDFLRWLQDTINSKLGTTGHIHKGVRARQLRYARKDTIRIVNAMYYNPDLPRLKRKFAKAQKILKMFEPKPVQVEKLVDSYP